MAGTAPRPSFARDHGDHKVTFTVTIAKAILAVDSDAPVIESSKKGKKLAVYEAPKPQNYFHLEYKLFPDDIEPVKTDVVVYGVAAKIYNENESKVLKTWKEGDKIWIAWRRSVSTWVTKEFLLKLFEHTVELCIWDSKDKVSPRARFDRPKAFKLPAGKENEEDANNAHTNVKALVVKQSLSLTQLQPRESSELTDVSDLPRQTRTASGNSTKTHDKEFSSDSSTRATTAPTGSTSLATPAPSTPVTQSDALAKVQVKVVEGVQSHWSHLARLAGLAQPLSESEIMKMTRMNESDKRGGFERERPRKKLQVDELDREAKPKRRSKKEEQKMAALAASVRAQGIASISVQLSMLFAGLNSVTSRLGGPVSGIEDIMVTVSLDKPLLSEEQNKDLNPMVMKLCSVSDLPNKPLSYSELQEKCVPVFAQYQFYKQPSHRTVGRPHGRNVFWGDINVVLLGTLDQGGFQEFLQGPPLQVEIHDRDQQINKKRSKADLFGENPEDEMINNVTLVAARRTTHNPFEGRQKPWDPYGIAKLDLSEFLSGQRYLYISVPVHSCSSPDPTVGHERPGGSIVGQPGSVDGPEEDPLPAANYLEAGTELKVKIEIAHPLTTAGAVQERRREPHKVPVAPECPFTRIIYVFDYSNTRFLKDLQNEITEINASALELKTLPLHVIEAALSTYKLSEEQKSSKSVNILTGFQIIDGVRHIFVVEGLRDEGIKQLVENLPLDQNHDAESVKVLYKSDMTFSGRLYASLDVDLCRVRLHDSLTSITQKPLLYVRDIVPRPCFEGLTRLDKILSATKLREVVRNDLFPTPEMIVSISREFGVPLTAEDFGETEGVDNCALLEEDRSVEELQRSKTCRKWSPLHMRNPEYLELLRNRKNTSHDFIMENILQTRTRNPGIKPKTVVVSKTELRNNTAHNYSTQALNSTELSRRKLKEILNEDPGSIFTYCPEYNSASVVTVDSDDKKKEEMKAKAKWLTPKGFVAPGSKSAQESNHHPLKPGTARRDELNKPWRENVHHANILKPSVDRIVFPWKYRDKDMDLITRPANQKFVGTIHLHGEAREQEIREANEKEKHDWQSRIVVDDVQFRTHRCLPTTELTNKGNKASNPLAKLENILKDPPQKFSLREHGLKLDKMPALSTVTNGLSDRDTSGHKETDKDGGYNPGPFQDRSWRIETNRIPCRSDIRGRAKDDKHQDFRLVFREKTATSRRQIEPLLAHERDNHLFASTDSPKG